MPTPFSSDDLGRIFDARTLTRGRSLLLIGAVEVGLAGDTVTATVDQAGTRQTVTLDPKPSGNRVALNSRCTCQAPACVHVAAAAYAALERFPTLRKAAPGGLLDALTGDEAPEKRVAMFEPVHGSAPPLAGKDLANPIASFLTVGMMLAHLGWPEEEGRIERACTKAINEEQCTNDVGGTLGTRACGDWLISELKRSFG